MKNLAERFLKAREHMGMTQAEVASQAGVLQQSVTKIEKSIIKNPKKGEKFAEVLKVPVEWLMLGKGEAPLWALKEENKIPENYLPILEWDEIEEWIENGAKNLNMKEDKRDFVPSPLIDQPERKKLFALRVNNDFMVSYSGNLSFNIGTILIVEPMNACNSGNYIIIKKRDEYEPIFRQIVKEGKSLFLKPLNAQYSTIKINDDYIPFGVVIARIDVLI